jgi:hypothetical protein
MARSGQVMKDRVVARLLPPESLGLYAGTAEYAVHYIFGDMQSPGICRIAGVGALC